MEIKDTETQISSPPMPSSFYLCITPFFPSPDNWRGAYVLDQVKAIQRNSGYEVIVFKPQSSKVQKEYTIDGITVHTFHCRQSPSYFFNGIFNRYNGKSFVKAFIKSFGNILGDIRFIHCHTISFACYGLALKQYAPQAKVMVQHHDLDPYCIRNGKLARWKPNALFRAKTSVSLVNQTDLDICISTPCKDSLLAFPQPRKEEVFQSYIDALKPVSKISKAHPKNVYVLYNGVDTSMFHQIGRASDHNVFRIGCIANFQVLKDHITLIKAVEALVSKGYDNIRLSLLGTGETRGYCERYIREHALDKYLEWPKEIIHDKLPEYYQSLDLFVLPSVFEGFGCVYTEAAACGVPFIGVYNNGAAEVIQQEERQKWLINPHDYIQLATLIENQITDPQVQHLCQPYDIDILVRMFLDYIETL